MARLPRYILPGQPQHVIHRGNNRQAVFGGDDDYRFYRDCLGEASKKHQCDIHAYVLMTNHVHLLVTPQAEAGIGKMMQSVGRRYVQYFNHTYQRTGTLWEGRYRATLVDAERYLLRCYRYIELNPVRAERVNHPRDYPWSSYRCHADGYADPLVVDHNLYLALHRNAEERRKAYRALFRSRLDEQTLGEIRDTLNKGWVLGSERFKGDIAALGQRRVQPLPKGRPVLRGIPQAPASPCGEPRSRANHSRIGRRS
jgi:putative transposase